MLWKKKLKNEKMKILKKKRPHPQMALIWGGGEDRISNTYWMHFRLTWDFEKYFFLLFSCSTYYIP